MLIMVTLVLALTLITSSQPVESLATQVKYVHPSNDSASCTVSEPCTFDQYATDSKQHFHPNTAFIFLPGEHRLNISLNLESIHNVSFQGMLEEGPVMIMLGPQVGLSFTNCTSIGIDSLNFVLQLAEYGLMFSDTTSVDFNNVLFTEDGNSSGCTCSAVISEASDINIINSSFIGICGQFGAALRACNSSNISFMGTNNFSNNSAKFGGAIFSIDSTLQFDGITIFIKNTAMRDDYDSGIGGAVYANRSQVIVNGCGNFSSNKATILGGAVAAVENSTVKINGSSCLSNRSSPLGIAFTHNCVTNEAYQYGSGSGGAIYTVNSEVNITHTSFSNNFSPAHGGAAYFFKSDVTLCSINAAYNNASNYYGGAIRFYQCTQVNMSGNNSFINNYAQLFGGAIEFCKVQSLSIAGVNYFEENVAENGGAFDAFSTIAKFINGNMEFKHNAAYGSGGAIYLDARSTFTFTGNTVYKNNSATFGGALSSCSGSQIYFYAEATFQNNHAENSGGAIYSSNSKITYGTEPISNNLKFQFNFNVANYGGAIAMSGDDPKLVLNPNVMITFIENKAWSFGGAIFAGIPIYSEPVCPTITAESDIRPECFIMLNTCYNSWRNDNFSLIFTNNNAGKHGNILYGGWLNICRYLFKNNAECTNEQYEISAFEIFKNISSIMQQNGTSTTFSSKPSSLCIFNDSSTKQCGSPMPRYVFPGGIFNETMQVVDQYNHPIDRVEVKSNQSNTGDYRISLNTTTTNLSNPNFAFHVLVYNEELVNNESELNFSLYIDLDGQCRNSTHFNITVQQCPLGFEFSPDIRKCKCAKQLQKYREDCNIDKMTIGRSNNKFWISYTTEYILLRDGGCPLDYCKNTRVSVPLGDSESDMQCSDGRTGTLCGECISENYSLALGTLTCIQDCTNIHPLLIFPMGALGILLIVLLFVLHLTVASGTINGLLLYANIIQANHQIFLPTTITHPFKYFYFYTVFIGWLNLDFGIETCFHKNMDILTYSWLQFLFPVYLWILMIIIIISAHYSRRVSKSLGQNPVAVFATVLLISYGKMLKAIIVPFSWAEIKIVTQENPNKLMHNETVWLYNGNVQYGDRHGHVILVVFAGLVLLFLFLPYTFLLLCGHWLQAKSHWRLLSWINKLKPFMDAYHAPYQRKSHHWIGIFLLARCSLFLTTAFNAEQNQNLTLLIITSVTAGLSVIKGRVYEKWYNDFLESSFLLNLCFLAITTFYLQSEESSDQVRVQSIISSVSVGIAFIYFIGIIAFHAYPRIPELKFFQNLHKSYTLKKQRDETAHKEHSMKVIPTSIVSVDLREPLLEDDHESQP